MSEVSSILFLLIKQSALLSNKRLWLLIWLLVVVKCVGKALSIAALGLGCAADIYMCYPAAPACNQHVFIILPCLLCLTFHFFWELLLLHLIHVAGYDMVVEWRDTTFESSFLRLRRSLARFGHVYALDKFSIVTAQTVYRLLASPNTCERGWNTEHCTNRHLRTGFIDQLSQTADGFTVTVPTQL